MWRAVQFNLKPSSADNARATTHPIRHTDNAVTRALTMALQILEEIKPGDGLQAMLAVQMIGIHFAATATLSRAGAEGSADGPKTLIRRATRLMHLFTQQTELMAKLKVTWSTETGPEIG
jgi:hypothetical protein